ncbi:primosomal replication protein N [Pandoraea sp.]|uniref:primosomal replication protein N n=1 Tax=Pandoraea sp. TaxID=1883445 RepID=UPI00120A214F|nr:primosomal replication protein N [Pandoraea sp.]TAL52345.1 MAG: primosomal replication protein N [Pandoraea sp.]TAM16155.1 MAG: primosomal replication protein N [Pandoraea sp.]
MNRLQLEASVVEMGPLRYTPAGIPAVECTLTHAGSALEAGTPRQIEFNISAVALGEIVERVMTLGLGQPVRLSGFLARKYRNSRTLVFHITALQEIGRD